MASRFLALSQLLLLALAQTTPRAETKVYDYVIVGGGQSGLVIASRLAEDPRKSVLVIEYGDFPDAAQLEPSSGLNYRQEYLYNVTTQPQPYLNNRSPMLYSAAVVGGGSAVNSMYLMRGSADDYDNWAKFGNPGWDFKGVLPYFKKSTTYTPPRAELAKEYNITWDIKSAYGHGPIQMTMPDWAWPGVKVQWQAWKEIGVPIQIEGANGNAFGAFWVPSALNQTYHRSYARNAYFDPASTQPNLKLIVRHRVNEIIFEKPKGKNPRAVGVTVQPRDGSPLFTVKAKQEVVLTAGSLHTPQILQRSGVGPRWLLEKAGVKVLVDLPGVGSNLQDHPTTSSAFTYQNDVTPNPSSLITNATFREWADALWANERRGPRSFIVGSSMVQAPLPILSPRWSELVKAILAQDPASVLPKTYTREQLAGWSLQRKLLAESFSRNTSSVIEIPFSGGARTSLVLERQLSRGTVFLNSSDLYAEPIVDFHSHENPVDRAILVDSYRFYRKFMQAPANLALGPVEVSPGPALQTDEELWQYAAAGGGVSSGHLCCTSAMGAKSLGGVLNWDMQVYGVDGLSVGDNSAAPLIVAAHTCATVYAISEKAADLIKKRYNPRISPAQPQAPGHPHGQL